MKFIKVFEGLSKHKEQELHYCNVIHYKKGTAVTQWLRCCATNQKVAVSIPTGVSGVPRGFKPPEIPKALQNHAKLNPIVKTIKNCWI